MAKTILTLFQQRVLDILVQDARVTQYFYLTGGTALAEFYLHHRLSEDLDFFSEQEFTVPQIEPIINALGSKLKITDIQYRNQLGLHTFFLRKGADLLKIDFNYYPFTQLEKGKMYQKLSIDSLHDIAVNKLQTIATQPRSRDFIDLFCIIKEKGWTIDELRKQARNKFDWYVDALHLGSRMAMVKEIKDMPKMLIPFNQKACEQFWLTEAKKISSEVLD